MTADVARFLPLDPARTLGHRTVCAGAYVGGVHHHRGEQPAAAWMLPGYQSNLPMTPVCDGCKAVHEAAEHRVGLDQFTRGLSPIKGGGRFVGYYLSCACGWRRQVNDTKPGAVEDARDHLRAVGVAERDMRGRIT